MFPPFVSKSFDCRFVQVRPWFLPSTWSWRGRYKTRTGSTRIACSGSDRLGSTRINLDRPGSTKSFTESKRKDTFTHLWFHSHENKAILAILRRFVGPPFYFQVSDPRGASYETPVQPQVALVVCKVTGPNTTSASR